MHVDKKKQEAKFQINTPGRHPVHGIEKVIGHLTFGQCKVYYREFNPFLKIWSEFFVTEGFLYGRFLFIDDVPKEGSLSTAVTTLVMNKPRTAYDIACTVRTNLKQSTLSVQLLLCRSSSVTNQTKRTFFQSVGEECFETERHTCGKTNGHWQ